MTFSPRRLPLPRARQPYAAPAAPASYQVRGQRATSYEYNYALALEYFELEYLFQVDYWGGRAMTGGIVLDFLVFTPGAYTPVWIQGEYWHRPMQADRDRMAAALLAIAAPNWRPSVFVWGVDVMTLDQAKARVRKDFL